MANLTIKQREQLAQFAGLECRCQMRRRDCPYWGSCPMHSNGGQTPDYDRDEVAVGLLERASHFGYWVTLETNCREWSCKIEKISMTGCALCGYYANKTTIHEAICTAVLALLEEEK